MYKKQTKKQLSNYKVKERNVYMNLIPVENTDFLVPCLENEH